MKTVRTCNSALPQRSLRRLGVCCLGLLISASALSGSTSLGVGPGEVTTGAAPVTLSFPITRGGDTSYDVSLNYHTEDGTALADLVLHEPDPVDRAIQWASHLTYVKTPSITGTTPRLNLPPGTTGGTAHHRTPPVRPPPPLPDPHPHVLPGPPPRPLH